MVKILFFGKGKQNAKLQQLYNVKALAKYLKGGRHVYTFSLLSGQTCPYAKECHSKAVEMPNGKRKIVDGKYTKFRCFSASQEVIYKPVYDSRKKNTDILMVAAKSYVVAANIIESELPKNAGIVRIHVGGDFKTLNYFKAWLEVARRRPDVLFYAYTKSLPFWVKCMDRIPSNLILTASRGGHKDELIDEYNLREAVVVFSRKEARAKGLVIDKNDSNAADPKKKNKSFALLIHGTQPKGSDAGKAVRELKGEGSYGRKKK